MTYSEHRRALPFLAFGGVGVAGAPGTGDDRSALIAAVCELVVVMNALFSNSVPAREVVYCTPRWFLLAKKAHTWVVDVFQTVLGPAHTTKIHRISAHLLSEFLLRGNVTDGNSAYNETLHKAFKAA